MTARILVACLLLAYSWPLSAQAQWTGDQDKDTKALIQAQTISNLVEQRCRSYQSISPAVIADRISGWRTLAEMERTHPAGPWVSEFKKNAAVFDKDTQAACDLAFEMYGPYGSTGFYVVDIRPPPRPKGSFVDELRRR
jgi:hypothetical protein